MTDRELLQQALEALEWEWRGEPLGSVTWKTIQNLQARLAQPEPEPVAWQCAECGGTHLLCLHDRKDVPLYTAPPQREEGCAGCGKQPLEGWALYCVKCNEREWQGLTATETKIMWTMTKRPREFAEMLLAKLKEKNT